MSRYNRPGNRYGAGNSVSKVDDTRSVWKPKAKINDGSLDSASGKSDSKIKHTDVDRRTDWKPKAEIDESSDSASFSQNDRSTVPGESSFDDSAFGVETFKQTLNELNEYNGFKKVKQYGDKSPEPTLNASDDDQRPKHHVFDICPKKSSSGFKLKPSLLAMNREKRNQIKQSTKGQNIEILGPGIVLLKGYISFDDQISIVKTCRDLGIGVGGFYQPGYNSGTKLHLQMMCLGKNWDPDTHTYTELRSSDNSKPPGIPEKFSDMVKKAIHDSNEFIRGNSGSLNEGKVVPSMSPDICIVNFYTKTGRLGLHQDKDESEKSLKKGLPVVSFSIGDSAEFLYGETRAIDEADKVTLESGDVLIFGGKSRLIYHGVSSIIPDTAPTSLMEASDMRPGRLNLTFRMY
ncbi:putative DNA oxidative demethylase [Helianthus annuus]|uniref:DNA oxidative demethylase n=1 Tax=Helianthus annuus TaxID=4232 RepID=A0A9K3K064_HELAN|nr:putative DNA oxidative demethylase [Helianthus annuus]